jgi:hypothetical protein
VRLHEIVVNEHLTLLLVTSLPNPSAVLADLYQRRGDVEIGLPALTTMRNSKTRQRGIYGDIGKPRNRNPSLPRRVGIGTNAQLQN